METSFTVTAPASGINSYLELVSQGGTPTPTAAMPQPTGRGWSIALSGQTIPAGAWNAVWTLAKSGTTMSGATLFVRFYRRTMDGTYYPIAQTSLSSASFSVTKTAYTTASVNATLWQFIAGDTLYMDAFIFNGATAWASDVFTVYVSTSSSLGVTNEGAIFCPSPITTPAGLNCLIGAPSFVTDVGLPVRDQSFTLADALDQRSVLTLTGEDAAGTLSYTRGMPTMFSDSNQGLLYTGFVNSDKLTKIAAGGSAQLEHALTFMDNHYLADKRANITNYLNWVGGDIICDMIQQTLAQEGVTGAFALESDYTPTTLGQGTLTNAVTTTNTTPFTNAPNTATPPVTSNTGDLEIAAAGVPVTITESTTSDFGGGTLTNMVAANNSLSPTTVSALKLTADFPLAGATNTPASATYVSVNNYTQSNEQVSCSAYAKIWSGSQVIGTNDTFNYDIWIASTSPAFVAGVDFLCADGTILTAQIGQVDLSGTVGLFDQNTLSVDALVDLSQYAKDAWYTRTITLTGLNGKTITSVSVFIDGSAAGYSTVYIKNCYLGSAPGSPFFGTAFTVPNVNPPTVTVTNGFASATVTSAVVSVYTPLTSTRISPSHSISGVGLVRTSNVSWTASLPTNGPSVSNATSPYAQSKANTVPPANTAPVMVLLASYDGVTWLPCANNQPLPGLPAGANIAGLSLSLQEQFAAGSDPSAIPALLSVRITIAPAANQSTSDVTSPFGNATEWNSGTYSGTGLSSANQLTLAKLSHTWASLSLAGQTFTQQTSYGTASESAASGLDVISITTTGAFVETAQSRLDFLGQAANFTLEFDLTLSTNGYGGVVYRGSQWSSVPLWGGATWQSGYLMGIGRAGVDFYAFNAGVPAISIGSTFSGHLSAAITMTAGTAYHFKLVVKNNRHTLYFNNSGTATLDFFDNTITAAGGFSWSCSTQSTAQSGTASYNNLTLTPDSSGTWTSPSISLNALGTCGNTQIVWNEMSVTGTQQSTALVLASLDGGTTYQLCTNGATIPGLSSGTNVVGKSLLIKVVLFTNNPLTTPTITGLYVRVCGAYGTVTGTRISPALSLSPVGYIAYSNCMWNANIPTNTTVVIATSQDQVTWTNVPNNGAGAALSYWTNQPASTQDVFNSNTSANYTNTFKSGGSVATATYDTPNSRITLSGGSGGLYLNSAITSLDTDLFCDMDESDAGGLVWREVDTSNYYELGVYDASSSGGFTNQLRLYKVSGGTRTLLGSASAITFTRGTFHRVRVTMRGSLIDVYWDGACMQSILDLSPLGAGLCGLRNDGGTSRYYQLWIQPLGTNLSGQVLYTRVTMTTTDPSAMPQLFTLVACVRGSSIATGATITQLHTITTPFAAYFASELDTIVQASGDFYWYINRWKQLSFGPRMAAPAAFPLQSVVDPNDTGLSTVHSGCLLYQPQVTLTSSADLFRNEQIITDVNKLVTPPPEIKVADGSTTSWTMGYPLFSAPIITINNIAATVGIQGTDNNRQFYWQPGSASISYDSTLPKIPAGAILSFTYVGETVVNIPLENTASQTAQAALESGTSGIIAEIESATSGVTRGMTTAQATTFGNGLLTRFGNNNAVELVGATRYPGLAPGTVTALFLPEMMAVWNRQLPIIKVTTQGWQRADGTVLYTYLIDATDGPNVSNWARIWS